MAHDRAAGSSFRLTQELMAEMLGVRRQSVSEAYANLHQASAISYVRGNVRVDDRAALEGLACECYMRAAQPL